uniref:hypothetical protein n=1 Tax=Oceanobacillus sp. FSL K6-2867 TaxID=2954748 RepID=UPI00403F4783
MKNQMQESFETQDSLTTQEYPHMQAQCQYWNEELYRRPFHGGFGGFHGGFGHPFVGGFGVPFLGGLAGGLLASTFYNPYGYGFYPPYYPPYYGNFYY